VFEDRYDCAFIHFFANLLQSFLDLSGRAEDKIQRQKTVNVRPAKSEQLEFFQIRSSVVNICPLSSVRWSRDEH